MTVPLDERTIAQLCTLVGELFAVDPPGTVECDVAALVEPDLTVIDALARMQLAARRAGGAIEVRHPCPDVRRLLALTGLADVLPTVAGSGPDRDR